MLGVHAGVHAVLHAALLVGYPPFLKHHPFVGRFCVSQHPDIEAKIVEELASLELLATAQAPQPRPLQYEDLNKLAYLNLVIKVGCTFTAPHSKCDGVFTHYNVY